MHECKLFHICMSDKLYGISFNLFKFSFNMLGHELVDIVSLHNSTGWEKLHAFCVSGEMIWRKL